MKNTPYLARRARFLLGMTQAQFAEKFGVQDATVSRWERGRLTPSPGIWSQIRKIVMSHGGPFSEDTIRNISLPKYLSPIDDLHAPIAISKPVSAAIDGDFHARVQKTREGPHYSVSGVRALDIIAADPEWPRGGIVYAEAYCLSVFLGVWVNAVVTPLVDEGLAIVEYSPTLRPDDEGFKVRIVYVRDFALANSGATPSRASR